MYPPIYLFIYAISATLCARGILSTIAVSPDTGMKTRRLTPLHILDEVDELVQGVCVDGEQPKAILPDALVQVKNYRIVTKSQPSS